MMFSCSSSSNYLYICVLSCILSFLILSLRCCSSSRSAFSSARCLARASCSFFLTERTSSRDSAKFSSFSVRNLLRSEEHTSELQSRGHLVCRLLLDKKKKILITLFLLIC